MGQQKRKVPSTRTAGTSTTRRTYELRIHQEGVVINAFSVEFEVQYTKQQLKTHLQAVSCISFAGSSVQSDQKAPSVEEALCRFQATQRKQRVWMG
jgi:hypothetical protein